MDNSSNNYLADTMKFKPGAFACDVVWEQYFVLHYRLNTGGHMHSSVSRGTLKPVVCSMIFIFLVD